MTKRTRELEKRTTDLLDLVKSLAKNAVVQEKQIELLIKVNRLQQDQIMILQDQVKALRIDAHYHG